MNRSSAIAPIPEPQFRARYWRAYGHAPFPPLPMTLHDASTLTEQKLINNVIALGSSYKRQAMELRALQMRASMTEKAMQKRLRRYEWLLILVLAALCLIMLGFGLMWRAMA